MDKDIEVRLKELEARIKELEGLVKQKSNKGHNHIAPVRSRKLIGLK